MLHASGTLAPRRRPVETCMVRCAVDVVIGSKRQLFVAGFCAEVIDALLKYTATARERSEI